MEAIDWFKNWNEHLEPLARAVNVRIDRETPQQSRLKVALAYHHRGKPVEAISAMWGEHPEEYWMTCYVFNSGEINKYPFEFYLMIKPEILSGKKEGKTA